VALCREHVLCWVRTQKPIVTYDKLQDTASYHWQAVCPNLFTALPKCYCLGNWKLYICHFVAIFTLQVARRQSTCSLI
jgi:hypothetical protein